MLENGYFRPDWVTVERNGVNASSGLPRFREGYPAPAPEAAPAAGDAGPVRGADSVCPDSHPVKANDNSGIYHVPGQQHYGKTNARHCYASASAAQADGYRAARR